MSSVGAARERDAVQAALRGRLRHGLELAGGVDQRLGRDAAADQAGAAEPVAFDQHRVEAELPAADRGDIAARAAAEDEDLGRDRLGSCGSIHEQGGGMFQQRLDALDELGGVVAVDHAVIEGRRQVHHLAHDDLAVAHHRPLDDLVGADDARLPGWLITGVVAMPPSGPRLVMVMVEPESSSFVALSSRAAVGDARDFAARCPRRRSASA